MNLEVISGLLSRTRMDITCALSGKECIELLKDHQYDVLMLDQMMPGMSGIETLAVIKEQNLAEATPIIALTADAIVGAKENYLREGFDDYLSKPVMYEDLENILLKYIKKDLLKTRKEIEDEEANAPKPVMLVINNSSEKLNEIKELIGSAFKGVFVRDEEQARKYLANHEVELVISDDTAWSRSEE